MNAPVGTHGAQDTLALPIVTLAARYGGRNRGQRERVLAICNDNNALPMQLSG